MGKLISVLLLSWCISGSPMVGLVIGQMEETKTRLSHIVVSFRLDLILRI